MVKYNPRDWFTFIFRLHKADTFRTLLPMIVAIGVYSLLIAYFELYYFHVSKDSTAKNLSAMHNLLGFALSILLVFRTNTAYDRWWEGRRLWGSLVNGSRSMAYKLSAILPKEDEENRHFFRLMIPNFAFVLKNHLRKEFISEDFEYFPQFQPHAIQPHLHIPNQIALAITQRLMDLHKADILKSEHLFILNNEISMFADICGACERIRNTPIPFSYSSFLKKFIFLYTMTLPFGYVLTVGYWIPLIVMFVFYIMASLEVIAEEIEDPFGLDANDLPTDQISKAIRQSVRELI